MTSPFEAFDGDTPFRASPPPEKCAACAVQCSLSLELSTLLEAKTFLLDTATDLMGESGKLLDDLTDLYMPDELAGSMRSDMNAGVGQSIDELDGEITTLDATIAANSASCNGTLELQGSRAGTDYTVYMCTSKIILENAVEFDAHPPVHITFTENQG